MDINLTRIMSCRQSAELSGAIRKLAGPERVVTVGGVPFGCSRSGKDRGRGWSLFRDGNRCAAVGVYET
jgi:hypothetical protein